MSESMVRDLILVSSSEIEDIRRRVLDLGRAWLEQWAEASQRELSEADVQVCLAEEADTHFTWTPLQQGSTAIWWCKDSGADPMWRSVMLGAPQLMVADHSSTSASWMDALLKDAQLDLEDRIKGHFGMPALAGPEAGCTRVSAAPQGQLFGGMVKVLIQPLGYRLLLKAQGPATQAIRGPTVRHSDDPVGLSAVLHQHRVSLGVSIGVSDATVGELLALKSGDVIRFPSLITDPLPVQIDGQMTTLRADVGAHQGRWALALAGQTSNAASRKPPGVVTSTLSSQPVGKGSFSMASAAKLK